MEMYSHNPEPHLSRRKAILREFPKVRELFGIDRNLKYVTIGLVLIQLTTPFILPEIGWLFLVVCYFFGATISHALFLAIHEITHDLAFKKRSHNNLLAIFANLPLAFPFAMAFREYHGKHHWNQGEVGIDTDLPSRLERKIFRGYIGKLFWMANQIVFYAIRPLLILPLAINKWQVVNFLVQIAFLLGYFYLVSWAGIFYLLISMFFAGGLHPLAGHFIAEHYVFKEGQETYSYYGWMNRLTLNVGYHNEHHDFPNIPGSRLPVLRSIANSYYSKLYSHRSWGGVIWKFITEPSITLYSRVRRQPHKNQH